ncbi:MAG: galactokinase [Chitinophagia bacterium]|nr:galactokinase [Chitinophagia bacterium]
MTKQGLEQIFKSKFNTPSHFFKAPGRINLIGEHTDYNDGFVLPAGIDKFCGIAIAPSPKKSFQIVAADLNDEISFENIPDQPASSHWVNYIWGVIHAFKKRGFTIPAFNAVIQSDIPVGAGLSSSAALEVVFAKAFNVLFQCGLTDIDLTWIAKEAENNFVGLQCGIMDMFASVHAKKNHAIKLDCRNLEYEYVPMNLASNKILLIDTCVKHELASSEYNQRRLECESAVSKMKQNGIIIHSLRDASIEQVYEMKSKMSDDEFKRAKYVVEENNRLHQFVDATSKSNMSAAGALLYASHEGLKHDYEVSCPELDFLVETVKSLNGVWGGRLMGGGFGGCTINLVETEKMEEIKSNITAAYHKQFRVSPKYYIASTGDGACEF